MKTKKLLQLVFLLACLFSGCITPQKVMNKMELNPNFSLQMQDKFTKIFPCIVKDSIQYIKGKDSMVPFPMIIRKDSIIHVKGTMRDSIVYKFISVPGSTIYRVDTVEHNKSDLRRIDALESNLSLSSASIVELINENKIQTEKIKSLTFKTFAFGISSGLFLLLAGFIFFKKRTPLL